MNHRLPLALALLSLLALPARAGSVTADSINDRSAALQAAMQQLPRGTSAIRHACQSIQVGGFGLPRWRCTVWYEPSPADPQASPPGTDLQAPTTPSP